MTNGGGAPDPGHFGVVQTTAAGFVPNPLVVTLVAPPTTIQEARNAGAVPGTMLAAPLAPAEGPITVGVAAVVPASTVTGADGTKTTTPAQEPMVVVTVKRFWDSPTVKAARNVIVLALGAGVALIAAAIITNGSVFGLDWTKVIHLAIDAVVLAICAAYFGFWKKRSDNNPVQK